MIRVLRLLPLALLLWAGSLVPAAASDYGPQSSIVCPSGSVVITLGASIQTAVDANVAGTTFCIAAGTRRMTVSIKPKAGDKFYGEYGAVLNGAKVLTGAVSSAGVWYYTGQTQNTASTYTGDCKVDYPRCAYTNEVFIDDVRMRQVGTLEEVTTGKWFFDYTADRIYIGDDPAGHTVETSIADIAFTSNGVNNVVIKNLVMEKYANRSQVGVVQAANSGSTTPSGWVVDYNEVRLSHGLGIRVGNYGTISNNYVHHMGQLGIGGGGDSASGTIIYGMVADHNELSYNNMAGFLNGFESGGCKFAVSDGTRLSNNYSHDNMGPGLWIDTNNIRAIIEDNTVEDNYDNGIRVEIGFSTIIRNNIVRRNSIANVDVYFFGAGILNQNSRDVEVYGNTLEDNGGGISAIQQSRTVPNRLYGYADFTIDNFNVHDNNVTLTMGLHGVGQTVSDNSWFTSHGVKYTCNTYDLSGAPAKPFGWQNATRTLTEWHGYGLDVGTCAVTVTPPSISASSAGGATTLTITAGTPSYAWTASSPVVWTVLSPTSGTTSSYTGTLTATVAANSGAARSTTLTVAGQSVLVYQDAATPTPPPPPTAPSSLAISGATTTTLTASWTDNSGDETGFSIERSLDNTLWNVAGSVASNTTSFLSSGLTSSTRYYFRVRAYSAAGYSSYTPVAFGTTLTPPSTTIVLSAHGLKRKGVRYVNLTWTNYTLGVLVKRNSVQVAGGVFSPYTDYVGGKGSGSFTYQVCAVVAPTTNCSNTVTVIF